MGEGRMSSPSGLKQPARSASSNQSQIARNAERANTTSGTTTTPRQKSEVHFCLAALPIWRRKRRARTRRRGSAPKLLFFFLGGGRERTLLGTKR